jgi:hypothetical protein
MMRYQTTSWNKTVDMSEAVVNRFGGEIERFPMPKVPFELGHDGELDWEVPSKGTGTGFDHETSKVDDPLCIGSCSIDRLRG